MLVELNLLLKPRLFIMDGIIAMEGNGPRSGTPVKMNCIIVSSDPVAIDSTFCRMINIDPATVPTNKYGKMYGLGTYDLENIEYVGDPIEDFMNPYFKIDRKPVSNDLFKSIMPAFVRNQLFPKPMIDPEKCVKCGICVSACPVEGKALNFKDSDTNPGTKDKTQPPVYDYDKCIRCYCCQEMCPHHAIHVK
jgi:ferredoxin